MILLLFLLRVKIKFLELCLTETPVINILWIIRLLFERINQLLLITSLKLVNITLLGVEIIFLVLLEKRELNARRLQGRHHVTLQIVFFNRYPRLLQILLQHRVTHALQLLHLVLADFEHVLTSLVLELFILLNNLCSLFEWSTFLIEFGLVLLFANILKTIFIVFLFLKLFIYRYNLYRINTFSKFQKLKIKNECLFKIFLLLNIFYVIEELFITISAIILI